MTLVARPRPVTRGIDTSALRRQARGLRHAAALLLVPVLVLVTMAVAEHDFWASLPRTGVRTPAEVVGASVYPRASDRIRVAFATPDGHLVEASVPVGDLSRYSRGSTVEVAYDPANPRRVRTVEDWDPPYGVPIAVASAFALLAVAFLWRAWRWPSRLRRVARHATGGRPMILSSVHVRGRGNLLWAVLSEPGGDASGHELAFRLADVRDAPVGPVPVELVGKPRARMVGFVQAPTGIVWPAGKIRRPPRAVRAALERERQQAPAPAEAAAAAALPELRGDLPPLPPDFFTSSPPRDEVSKKALVALAPMLLVVCLPFILPDVIEAHRHECVAPPVAGTGTAVPLSADVLAATIPTTFPGFTPTGQRARDLGSFANGQTDVALVDGGFTSGYERTFEAAQASLQVEVLQFTNELGPKRYEAQHLATLCTIPHRHLAVPQGSGASGTVIQEKGQRPLYRMTFVRGSRDYVVNVEGPGAGGEGQIVSRLMATAR